MAIALVELPHILSKIYTTYYYSPVGSICIEGTEDCIQKIIFRDPASEGSNPQSEFLPPLYLNTIEQLIEYFSGHRRQFEFPMEMEGTEFQKRVWTELMNIPFGKTISYTELSKRLGDPKTIRAAASANGKNCLAIVIPCHRVIGARGDLVGYAGGLKRKKWLLDHENKQANGVLTLF